MTLTHKLFMLLLIPPALCAQETAIVSGSVVDESDAPVLQAQVTISNNDYPLVRKVQTDPKGLFVLNLLLPGDYSLVASKQGFSTMLLEHVIVSARDRRSVQLTLKTDAAIETIDKVADPVEGIDSDSSPGIALRQDYFQPLPLDGRDVLSLVTLTPGVVNPEARRDGQDAIDVDGLRPTTNSFVVDGARDTTPVAGDYTGRFGQLGIADGGVSPAGGINSAFNSLALDALAEVKVQTLGIAPEFGWSAGGQISMTTRSGANELHGSAYDYVRNTSLNANDYFASASGIPRQETKQNRFGGAFGGPLEKRDARTFYFASYEQLNLSAPQTLSNVVPAAAARAGALSDLQPYLNAFPVANGRELGQGAALFTGGVSNPVHSKSGGLRVDRVFSPRWTGFLRYGYYDWSGDSRGTEEIAANMLTHAGSVSQTLTAGLLHSTDTSKINDLRLNYSISRSDSSSSMDNFGGATPLSGALVFPAGTTTANGSFDLAVLGASGYSLGTYRKDSQQQLDIEDSQAIVLGTHEYKIGADFRRITQTYYNLPYSGTAIFNGISSSLSDSLLSGDVVNTIINLNMPRVYPVYLQIGAYAQDTWKVTNGLTITYGARWDIDPAPRVRSGPRPFAIDGNGIISQTLPLYIMQWKNVSPRVGFAYQFDQTPGEETVIRGGFGVFYDTGFGNIDSAFNSAPYQSSSILTGPTFPQSVANLQAAPLGTAPYGVLYSTDNNLQSARIFEYNVMVDHYFGRNQVLTVGYVANQSSSLTSTQSQATFTQQYDLLNQIENGTTSSYKSLQVQFRRRLWDSLQLRASYVWSHAVDTASTDAALGGAFAVLTGTENGDSNFDIRHQVNVSGSYSFPRSKSRILGALTKDWNLDFNGTYRTSLPFSLLVLSNQTSASTNSCLATSNAYCDIGVFSLVRPNQAAQSVWLTEPGLPGDRQLNLASFAIPAYTQGSMDRNALRGFGASQIDLALRRKIALRERLSLTISAEVFNLLNHASFANPTPFEGANVSSPNFGVVTRSLDQGFGGSSLYGLGGPRNIELAVRLQF